MINVRSETDKTLTEAGQGKAERIALGSGYGAILRILAFVLGLIVLGGLVTYFLA